MTCPQVEVSEELSKYEDLDETNEGENDKDAEHFEELLADKIHELLESANTDEESAVSKTFGMNLTENGGYVWNVSMIVFKHA